MTHTCIPLITGIFPNKLNIAKIIASLQKKNNRHDFNNYRHNISILPSISKIFEKVVCVQLFKCFTTSNLFRANQHGVRAEYSTELAFIYNLLVKYNTDIDDK